MAENRNAERKPRSRGQGKPFAKGKSGNPGGRPHGFAELRAAARAATTQALAVLVNALVDIDSRVRIQAARELLDRGWGRPSAMESPQEDALLLLRRGKLEAEVALLQAKVREVAEFEERLRKLEASLDSSGRRSQTGDEIRAALELT